MNEKFLKIYSNRLAKFNRERYATVVAIKFSIIISKVVHAVDAQDSSVCEIRKVLFSCDENKSCNLVLSEANKA